MKKAISLILSLVFFVCAAAGCGSGVKSADPSPLMWKATDGSGHVLYLFGTIHLGDERTDRVMELIGGTVDSCDAVAVEFNTVAYLEDYDAQLNDIMQFVLADGSTVKDHMPADLHQRAVDLLTEAGLYNFAYDYYGVALWSELVTSAMIGLESDLTTDFAADPKIIKHAMEKDMPVLEVESSNFQYSLLANFPDELYLLMIEDALNSRDGYGTQLDLLYNAWLSGNAELIKKLSTDADYSENEDLTGEQIALLESYDKALISDRNVGMTDKAEEYLASGDTVFLAVGTAHMLGEDGIVSLLKARGYTVEPYDYTDKQG